MDVYCDTDYEAALKEFNPVAEQMIAEAQHNLEVEYGNGPGLPQNNIKKSGKTGVDLTSGY